MVGRPKFRGDEWKEPAGRLHAGTAHLWDNSPYRSEKCAQTGEKAMASSFTTTVASSYVGIPTCKGGYRKRVRFLL